MIPEGLPRRAMAVSATLDGQNPWRRMSARAKKIAVFPGQFDPITNGHLDVIRRSVTLFDELVVGVGINPDKREFFSHDERVVMIQSLLKDLPSVRVERYDGLTVDFRPPVEGDGHSARHPRRFRSSARIPPGHGEQDGGGVETVFMMTGDQYALVSSSLIRQVWGWAATFDR